MAGTHSGAGRIASLRLPSPHTHRERRGGSLSIATGCSPSATALRYGGTSPLRLSDDVDEIIAGGFRACVVFPIERS